MDSYLDVAYASVYDDGHVNEESHESIDSTETDSAEHGHTDGEHCIDGDLTYAHYANKNLQKIVSITIRNVLSELDFYNTKQYYHANGIFYDSSFISSNSFQRQIRSVLIRV